VKRHKHSMPKVKKWFNMRGFMPSFAIKKLAINAQPARAAAEFDVVSEQHFCSI